MSLLIVSCGAEVPAYKTTLLQDNGFETLRFATVALVNEHEEEEGAFSSYCSGVFITSESVLTAAHCVRRYQEIQVGPFLFRQESDESPLGDIKNVALFVDLQNDGWVRRAHEFRVSQYDKERDLAVLYVVDREALRNRPHTSLEFPIPRYYQPGEKVYAMGHPVGMWWTLTEGIVSRDRAVFPEWDNVMHLQVTADSYFGNSGGPLVDANGNLIGIASAIVSRQSHISLYVHPTEIEQFLFNNGN